MSVSVWPDLLPQPQTESFAVEGPPFCDAIDVLVGPSRVRLARRYAINTFSWQVWLKPEQVEEFEAWYAECVEFDNGEMYLPWLGNGRVVAFTDEYSLTPIGRAWRLSATVSTVRIDQTLTDMEVCTAFGERVYTDNGLSLNRLTGDLEADLIIVYRPNEFSECGLIRNPGAPGDISLSSAEGTNDQLIDDGEAEDIVIDDFPISDFEPL